MLIDTRTISGTRVGDYRDYAERYCKIDRTALMELFNSIRYGK